jgi:hypothetical protein
MKLSPPSVPACRFLRFTGPKILHNCYNTLKDHTINKTIMPERRQSHPKAPTGLNDETAEEVHDIIHNAEVEEQKVRHRSSSVTYN